MNPRIPILICIDVEPDGRAIDPQLRVDWVGFEESFEFFSELRQRLGMATGSPVHFSWFLRMDPQVAHTYGSPDWVVTRYPQLIEKIVATGDGLGIHTHAWRWDENAERWISDYGDQQWIDHCVRSSFEAFQTSLNRQCRSFRFGDHWMNNQTIGLLEKLGTRFDLTLEPGESGSPYPPDEPFTGAFPDYTAIPQTRYRPHKSDFRKRGFWRKRKLWIIPISAGSRALPDASPSSQGPRSPAAQPSPIKEYMTLILACDPLIFSRVADRLLSGLKRPYLALPARTDMTVKLDQRSNLERNIEHLASHPLIKHFVFETPEEAIKRL